MVPGYVYTRGSISWLGMQRPRAGVRALYPHDRNKRGRNFRDT
jgi:hypothetical protein